MHGLPNRQYGQSEPTNVPDARESTYIVGFAPWHMCNEHMTAIGA